MIQKVLLQAAFHEPGNMSALISFHGEMLSGYRALGLEAKACFFSLEVHFQASATDVKHLFRTPER
jgi:hypothetical protein